ncbi:hypothetical protein PMAYCL1PPCAC_11404, partial [Pristionchus mayeri]
CDYDIISSSNKEDKDNLLIEMNTISFPPFTCKNGMLFVLSKQLITFVNVEKVFCERSVWNYKEENQPFNHKLSTVLEKNFSIYCTEKRCRKCDSPPPFLPCGACEKPASSPLPTDLDKCPELTCKNNKWRTTGTSIIQGHAECRSINKDKTKFAWFVKDTELKKAACLDKSELLLLL